MVKLSRVILIALAFCVTSSTWAATYTVLCLGDFGCFKIPYAVQKIPFDWPGPYLGREGVDLVKYHQIHQWLQLGSEDLADLESEIYKAADTLVSRYGLKLVDERGKWSLKLQVADGSDMLVSVKYYNPDPTPWRLFEPEPDPWVFNPGQAEANPEPSPWLQWKHISYAAQHNLLVLNQALAVASTLQFDTATVENIQQMIESQVKSDLVKVVFETE
jgi:hypothetical protein